MILGKLSGCHQIPERSFSIKGKQFPVCARCTGAFIGYFVGGILFLFFAIPLYIDILLCALMFVDWLIQRIGICESDNIRRVVTGFLCGLGLMQMYLRIIVFLFEFVYDLIIK